MTGKRAADAAQRQAEAIKEYEREQAEEDAARAIEEAIANADYRALSDDEQAYLDYGGF